MVKVLLSAKVEAPLKAALEKLAKQDQRTLSQIVQMALTEWLAQKKAKK
jgi:hypothetical protein